MDYFYITVTITVIIKCCFKGADERKMLVLISRLGRIVQIQRVSYFAFIKCLVECC